MRDPQKPPSPPPMPGIPSMPPDLQKNLCMPQPGTGGGTLMMHPESGWIVYSGELVTPQTLMNFGFPMMGGRNALQGPPGYQEYGGRNNFYQPNNFMGYGNSRRALPFSTPDSYGWPPQQHRRNNARFDNADGGNLIDLTDVEENHNQQGPNSRQENVCRLCIGAQQYCGSEEEKRDHAQKHAKCLGKNISDVFSDCFAIPMPQGTVRKRQMDRVVEESARKRQNVGKTPNQTPMSQNPNPSSILMTDNSSRPPVQHVTPVHATMSRRSLGKKIKKEPCSGEKRSHPEEEKEKRLNQEVVANDRNSKEPEENTATQNTESEIEENEVDKGKRAEKFSVLIRETVGKSSGQTLNCAKDGCKFTLKLGESEKNRSDISTLKAHVQAHFGKDLYMCRIHKVTMKSLIEYKAHKLKGDHLRTPMSQDGWRIDYSYKYDTELVDLFMSCFPAKKEAPRAAAPEKLPEPPPPPPPPPVAKKSTELWTDFLDNILKQIVVEGKSVRCQNSDCRYTSNSVRKGNDFKTKLKTSLESHLLNKHAKFSVFFCHLCNEGFKGSRDIHQRRHRKQGRNWCVDNRAKKSAELIQEYNLWFVFIEMKGISAKGKK